MSSAIKSLGDVANTALGGVGRLFTNNTITGGLLKPVIDPMTVPSQGESAQRRITKEEKDKEDLLRKAYKQGAPKVAADATVLGV